MFLENHSFIECSKINVFSTINDYTTN